MYLGVDIGGTDIKFGVVNADGRIVARAAVPTPKTSAEAVADAVAAGVKQLSAAFPAETVGVGTPGIVTPDGRVSAANLPFADTPLADLIAARIGRTAVLGNDANCAALGEAAAGGEDDLLLVTLGTGVGGGIVTGGKPVVGAHGGAGEIGHMCIRVGGRACPCGKRGCFEQYASASALTAAAKAAAAAHPDSLLAAYAKDGMDGKVFFRAVADGCPAAAAVLDAYLTDLAAGLESLQSIFDPAVIVLAGGITEAGDALLAPLMQKLGANFPLKLSSLRSDAGVIGAAALGRKEAARHAD